MSGPAWHTLNKSEIAMLHRLKCRFIIWKRMLYTKGGANPTFASAKVKNAIGSIGIFLFKITRNVCIIGLHSPSKETQHGKLHFFLGRV